MIPRLLLGRSRSVPVLWGFFLACGERAGDPVVRLEPAEAAGTAGVAGTAGAPGSGQGGAAPPGGSVAGSDSATRTGPIGLCGFCETSDECGDVNDACLRRDQERFCGRDCDEGFGCPDGYACVELENSRLRQCAPLEYCADRATQAYPPSLDEVRDYVLSRINAERTARDRTPLAGSACLDTLAQDSALDYAQTDEPLGKFVSECDPIWPDCPCDWSAQAEVAVALYDLDWVTAVEAALRDDRFAQSFLEFGASRVGIGFWISGDEAWIALSYS